MDSELLYTYAIKLCPGIGNISTKKIVEHYETAENAWKSSLKERQTIYGSNNPISINIGKDEFLFKADKEIYLNVKNSIEVIHYKENKFPYLLKQIPDTPVIIFVKGNLPDETKKNIAIVGTREMTNYGKVFIENLLEELKEYPLNIISGLANGVDITAQKKCIDLDIPTFGVLAHGLKTVYPTSNKQYVDKLLEKGGLISEYSYNTPPEREKFLQRNRIIAGLSSVITIIESSYGGGAMTTAKYGNSYDRDVFALPGRTTDNYSNGCNLLIKKLQAQILTSSKDLINFFDFKKSKPKRIEQPKLFIDLNETEQKIVDKLKTKDKIQIDELSLMLGIPTFNLITTLLNLELKNIVNPLPGKFFELK